MNSLAQYVRFHVGYQIYHHNDITVRITLMLRKPRKHVRTTV